MIPNAVVVRVLLLLINILYSSAVQQFRWVNLTQTELESWYSPTDLCLLNSTEKFSFPQDVRSKDCKQFSRGKRNVHCSVGMGNNRQPCFGPFNEGRPHFKMGIEGYTDSTSTPLVNAIDYFIKTNTTLFLLGDSTTRQKLQAMQCELERENHRIRTSNNIWGILPCTTKFWIYLPDKRSYYVRIVSLGPNSAECLSGGQGVQAPSAGAFENAAYMIDRENNVYNRSVFVVANMGLWYNSESEYSAVVPPLLEWLQQVATHNYPSNIDFAKLNLTEQEDMQIHPLNTNLTVGTVIKSAFNTGNHAKVLKLRNTVVWHETFSQHWINPWGTGYFAKPSVEFQINGWKAQENKYYLVPTVEYVSHMCCRPITNSSFMADWRNDIVNTQLQQQTYKDVKLFPMASITRPLVDMHTCNAAFFHDCTHYCFSPLMFQPFWHQIASLAGGAATIA